ncbi:MAG TPA: 50S ribosomal protein L31e [Candidatus Nanoarchaeia archaeon]|nr:50S ribosomal protein L31e [Candidatus Nanoarchaeia archaeon]
MTEIKQTLERTYVIPLKKEWSKVPSYKRTRKAIVAIKEFIARHMRVYDRDLDKIKIDSYLNNEIWARGSRNAPTRVKVRAVREKDIVRVTFADTPKHIGFIQSKHARHHKKADKKAPAEEKKKEEQTAEEKKSEQEKEQASAIVKERLAEQQTKADKHTTKAKTPEIHRMAMKK